MTQPYIVRVDIKALRVLVERTRGPFGGPPVRAALGQVIRRWGVMAQERAVRNVTGYPVNYDGRVFRVMVRTGTLRGAIELEWPYEGKEFLARVFVNGAAMNPGTVPGMGPARPRPVSEYAAAIEFGHPEIDLKKTMLGKTVPFFGARGGKARGPYAATGLDPVDPSQKGYGSGWHSAQLDRRLAAKGKGPMVFEKKGGNAAYTGAKQSASTYFIAFRKVGKVGWVIPEAQPRPFLAAALAQTADQGRRMAVRELTAALSPSR